MSFFNKIWKNIREKKELSHSLDITSSLSLSSGSTPKNESYNQYPLGQKGKTFYKRIDHLIHQQQSELSDENDQNSKKDGSEEGKSSSESGIEFDEFENVSPNTKDDEEVIRNDGKVTSDDEVILPPGIVTEMAKSKNQVSRHVSVSRSGRYKQKHRKRSNLFDVINPDRDGDTKQSANGTSSDVVAYNEVDRPKSSKKSPNVLVTSVSLSPAFDSNSDIKSIEQDVSQTVIEVEVTTTSQSLLSPIEFQSDSIIFPRSKEGVTINPTFITFSKPDKRFDSKQSQLVTAIPHFNYNNNSDNHNKFVPEVIKL